MELEILMEQKSCRELISAPREALSNDLPWKCDFQKWEIAVDYGAVYETVYIGCIDSKDIFEFAHSDPTAYWQKGNNNMLGLNKKITVYPPPMIQQLVLFLGDLSIHMWLL